MTTAKQERSEKCDDHISTAIPDLTLAEGSAGTPDTAKSPVQHKTYLLGFMPQSEVIAMLVGDLGLDANLARLQEVWMPRVQSATDLQANPFILDDDAHALAVQPIHWQSDSVRDAAIDHLASLRHWGTTKVELAMVRIDDLIVLQSNVTLERAHRLVAHLGPNPSFDDLLARSLGRGRPRTNIEHRWIGPNTLLSSSKDHDVRALQAEIRDVDGKRALVMPFGGGEPAIHCVRVYDYVRLGDGSLVRRWSLTLQNGFHRLYALRELGVELVPMIVVEPLRAEETRFLLANWSPERIHQAAGARPPLLRDFFEPSVTASFEVQETSVAFRVELKIDKLPI